jgi:TonB-linked SusC/RagA family outer membrane protein
MRSDLSRNNRKAFSVLLLCFSFIAGHPLAVMAEINEMDLEIVQQQQIKITGTVNDVIGPVIGASVVEKGNSRNGTITDMDGNFSLTVKPGATLAISYIGYKSQEVQVVTGKTINITLVEDSETLDEIVVIGFGTQKKVNLTGAVGLADAKDLESRPVTSATQALQGMVPGLQISTNSGELDKNMSINIRGAGTIGEGSSGSPLILIDGMEGDLNTVNPQDIENISVLKDAAASSIYGSRAPFGVILVTTKNGKQGHTSINYNNSFRVSSPINLPKMMDSYTFANFLNSASINSGGTAVFGDDLMQKMLDFQAAGGSTKGGLMASSNGQWGKPDYDPFTTAYANTDWYSEAYKSHVFSQEHNISLNGGSEKITYYASFNFLDQGGLLRHGSDGMKRYNVTAKINATLTDWLRFNYSSRFTRTDNWRPRNFNNSFYDNFGRQTWPNMPVYDENGYYHNGGTNTPPLMLLALGGDRKVQTDRQYHQAAFVIEPIKNWLTHVEFNYSIMNAATKETNLPVYNHDVEGKVINTNGTSSLYQDQTKENYLNLNIYSEYSHTFNEVHNFKVMAGFQAEDMKQEFSLTEKYGLMMDDMPYFDLTTGVDGAGKTKETKVEGYGNEWSTAGFFGRLNYDYQGRYLAEFNLRYDGTSRFRKGNRWQWSPSFSLGWNIAQEKFWEPLSKIANTLKLRASYGELGNQNTEGDDNHRWYPTYRIMNIQALNGNWLQNGSKPNTASVGDLVSNILTWEKVRTWDIGLDYGLFNNRLTGSFDYYIRYTDGMVGPSPELPSTLGITAPKTNNCDLKTIGWELALGWRDRFKNGLGYGINLTLSDARTIIDKYPGNATNSLGLKNSYSGAAGYIQGREIGEIWGFETIGIAKTDAEMQAHLDKVGGQSNIGTKWGAGDIMYADLDGKPGITKGAQTLDDHGDLKVIGNSTPRYLFGIDLNADWKGFDVRIFLQGVMKRNYWGEDNFNSMLFGVRGGYSVWHSRGLTQHADYFRAEAIGLDGHKIPANLDAYYPRPIVNEGVKNQQSQTRYLQNASYIRLKNFQVGYTLPVQWMQKIGFTKCRIFVSGENLWTGTSLSNLFDPETISGGNGGNAYPLSSTWSFGLSLTL